MRSNNIAHCSYRHNSQGASVLHRGVSLKRNYLLKRVQKTCEKFQEKPLPPVFKAKLDGPSVTWRVFSRLLMATKYADSSAKDCMIFSFEKKFGETGQRLFLVAHPQKMWINHRMKREERCSYEVIRENYPCKLYFDLEFYTRFNSEKNGNLMTKTFIKCVIAAMYEQHSLLIKESDFLWLNASNEEKFSCHLILQMKGIAFKNNIYAGTFVSVLISTLRERIEKNAPSDELWPTTQEIKNLLVNSKKEKEIFYCDEGVYTKNRNFRMYLSTKQGKNSPLMLSKFNKYKPLVNPKFEEEAIFYDSLITYFRSQKNNRLLSYEEAIPQDIIHSSYLRKMRIDNPGISGCTTSPFPDLDSFVLAIVKDELVIGFIRKWTYISNEQKIIYAIGNYRYCNNIGRHHKSNNIMIVVDMKEKYYYQTCLDPECRHESYRSEATAIPMDIFSLNVPDDFFDSNCFTQLQPQENIENNNDALHCSEELFVSSTDIPDFKNWCDLIKSNQKVAGWDSFGDNFLDKNMCLDEDSNFADFSELCKINNEIKTTTVENSECINMQPKVQMNDEPNQESWDAFFVEDFSCTQKEINQDINENMNEDFSFLDTEDSWDIGPVKKDSAVSLGNVSLEEEMLMAEAVEAVEATIRENIFSEETIF